MSDKINILKIEEKKHFIELLINNKVIKVHKLSNTNYFAYINLKIKAEIANIFMLRREPRKLNNRIDLRLSKIQTRQNRSEKRSRRG